jgi:hypothetical protein
MNSIWLTWGQVFNSSLQELWWSFMRFVPGLVVAIILFVIGWFLGSLISKAIEQVFGSLKIDNLFRSVGVENFLRKAGVAVLAQANETPALALQLLR